MGQMDSFDGRLDYARYLATAHPDRLEEYLAGFDPEERSRLEAGLARWERSLDGRRVA